MRGWLGLKDGLVDKSMNEVEEGRYMKGWKISKTIHMFTQPLKCPGGGPNKHETEKGSTRDTTSTQGDPNPMKRGIGCREKVVARRDPLWGMEDYRDIVRKVIVVSQVTLPIEQRGSNEHCGRSPVPPGTVPLPLPPPPPLHSLLPGLSLPPIPPSPANIICRQGAVL